MAGWLSTNDAEAYCFPSRCPLHINTNIVNRRLSAYTNIPIREENTSKTILPMHCRQFALKMELVEKNTLSIYYYN